MTAGQAIIKGLSPDGGLFVPDVVPALSKEEIENRVNDTFYAIFEGHNRFYFDGINETGYFMDTGNCDARTEGMSYGMLMCVLMDKKEYFDKMWKFSMDFMYMDEGYLKGYFAWSVAPDGKKNAFGPAPDGEEFYAMALFLAGKKWGDGDGIYNYTYWRCILCLI